MGSLPPIGADMRISCVHCTVDNNSLMVALVEYGKVYRFAGILHQLAQNRMDNRQQITAL